MIGQNLMVVNGLLEWKRKVGTKRSWLDIMSWLDMHWYRGGKRDESYLAMSLGTLVIILVHWVQKFWYWGGFVAIKTKFCFERHVWTSAKNDTPWKRWEKCLWVWPLCWSILFGHPLMGFVLKIGKPNVWKKLKIKCPDMTNGIDLRLCPHKSRGPGLWS